MNGKVPTIESIDYFEFTVLFPTDPVQGARVLVDSSLDDSITDGVFAGIIGQQVVKAARLAGYLS